MSVVAAAVVTTGVYSANKASKAANRATDAQMEIADRQLALSEEQWAFYKETYQPLEKDLVAQVEKGVDPDYKGVTGRASQAVRQSFGLAESMEGRRQASLGVNPNSGASLGMHRLHQIEEAKADAGAQTMAHETERRSVDDINFNRKLAVAGQGKGLPSSAQYGMASAGNMQSSIATNQANSAANQAYGIGKFIGSTDWSKKSNPFAGWGDSVGDRAANGQLGPPNAGEQGVPPDDFADGGEVDGPGTGTSDSIPARLSDGEYIIPEDVVRRKGTEFFDKLLERHHKPVRGMPNRRPGDQAEDAEIVGESPRLGLARFADGGSVKKNGKPSPSVRDRTRKALEKIGL